YMSPVYIIRFFNAPPTTRPYTLSLHDALPILTQFSVGALVGHGKELLAFLSLQENATHAHMISEPSLIATDSIPAAINVGTQVRSEEHTSELQSRFDLVCRLLLEKKKCSRT